MANRKPLVSIIVRTKDRPGLLRRAIKSIVAQTHRPIEIVLVNDGGADAPIDALTPLLGDVSLEYIGFEENRGRSIAANEGIERARGDHIGFLDDDDIQYPDHVETLLSAMEEDNATVAYDQVQAVYYKWPEADAEDLVKIRDSHLYDSRFDGSRLLFENYIPLNALLFSAPLLKAHGFDESIEINEDWDLLIRLSERHSFRFTPRTTAEYSLFPKKEDRQEERQIAQDREAIHAEWFRTVFDKHKARVTGRDWDRFYRGCLIPKHEREVKDLEDLVDSEQRRLGGLLDRKNEEFIEKDRLLAQQRERLKEGNDLIRSQGEALDRQAILLRQKDETLARQDALIQERGEALDQRDISIGQKDEALERQNDLIRERGEAIDRQAILIRQHEEALESGGRRNRTQAEALDRQTILLEQKDEALARQNALIHERGEALDRLEIVIRQKEEALERRNALIRERDVRIRENDDLIHRKEAMIQQKEAMIQQKEAVARGLDEALGVVLSSKSWKVTAPLRAAARIARYVRRGARYIASHEPTVAARRGLLEFYHSPLTGEWLQLFPTTWKQRAKAWMLVDHAPMVEEPRANETPRVSIVIPVYNHAEYLDQCISSAIAQDYENLEVVIVDDASPDPNVKPILEAYAGDPRVALLHHEANKGISEAQNHAISNATGDIVAFLDCDDFLTADAVSTAMADWRESTVYLHTARVNVDENNEEVNRISFEHLPRKDYFKENLAAMYATHFKLIRRDVFARVGLFDPRFDSAQDYDMLMRIAWRYPSDGFVFSPNFVYHHRFHHKQETSKSNDKQQRNTHMIQEEARMRAAISRGEFHSHVSIIMLSYGKHEQTREAIQSIVETVHIPFEIILFDNGSDPETVACLKTGIARDFPFVRIVYSPVNLGPAEGRRQAITHAKGPYYISFDNDEIAQPGWVEELLVRGETGADIGAVCARVYFPNNTLQFSGGVVEHLEDELIKLGLHDVGKSRFDPSAASFRDLDWAPIGATLYKVDPSPYLHGGYQNAFEDAGVSFQLRKRGYRLVNAPGALVRHNHFLYHETVSMKKKYLEARYNRDGLLRAMASFYLENDLILYDEYVWKESGLGALSREELKKKFTEIGNSEKR